MAVRLVKTHLECLRDLSTFQHEIVSKRGGGVIIAVDVSIRKWLPILQLSATWSSGQR